MESMATVLAAVPHLCQDLEGLLRGLCTQWVVVFAVLLAQLDLAAPGDTG